MFSNPSIPINMVIAVILAGGSGTRLGGQLPKQFLPVAGKTIIEHTIDAFELHPLVDEVCLVCREDYIPRLREMIEAVPHPKVRHIVAGGKERYHSTLAALDCYHDADDILLFHDAVRPLIAEETITACIEAMEGEKGSKVQGGSEGSKVQACAVGVPTTDTIWCINDGTIVDIPQRNSLMNAQTPQCFRQAVIREAYDRALLDPTFVSSDDCGVLRKYMPEVPIRVIPGTPTNIKITYASDLELAERLLSQRVARV